MDFRELLEEANNLEQKERAELAKLMLDSLDSKGTSNTDDVTETAWLQLAQARWEKINNGTVEPQGWDDIKSRLLAGKN